jgi:signal transduction histidine kinase
MPQKEKPIQSPQPAYIPKPRKPLAVREYEFKETHELISFVDSASLLIQSKGEHAFEELSRSGSKWRNQENYIFVIDLLGNLLVHPDPELYGKNKIDLKDTNGKPIIQGLIDAATSLPDKPYGWFHYQWPEPNDLAPRWKSSYVKLVKSPVGKSYVVGSGVYNNLMEKSFVIDMVKEAVKQVERKEKDAFPLFHDQAGRFIAKDAYIFVIDPKGVCLVHPAFPNLEGHNLISEKDSENNFFIKEMLQVAESKGSGWVNYLWPKPGDSIPTQKSSYIEKVKYKDSWLMVGCGVYLANAPVALRPLSGLTPEKLVQLVSEAAPLIESKGETVYEEFRKKGSKWFESNTYFFVLDMKGTRKLNVAVPTLEGLNIIDEKDVLGRPYGKMLMDIAMSTSGEGWTHYFYPRPGELFPAWKSVFSKRIVLPNGEKRLLSCGSYSMPMNEPIIEDVVNHAALLIQEKGPGAFDQLRDKKGPFRFMDTYIFVNSNEAMELVNGGTPYLEGKNVSKLKDAKGTPLAVNCIQAAKEKGSAWVDCYWYKPGDNFASLKKTFVRKVEYGKETFIVGSGFYVEERPKTVH